jgi:hypothetical protein
MKSKISKFFDNISIVSSRKINRLECKPIPYWGDLYVSGFKIDDSQNVMVHFKIVKKVDLTEAQETQVEYYMMNPDSEMWIECEALDSAALSDAISQLKKKVYKSTALDIMHITYREDGETVERNIAYDSRRIACKEAMSMRKQHDTLHFHFTKAGNKETVHHMTDLEFATAALE